MSKPKFLLVAFFGIIIFSCKNESAKQSANDISQLVDVANISGIDGVFDIPEVYVTPSPEQACQYSFTNSEKVVDYDVSPAGMIVAVIIEKESKSYIKFWKLGESEISDNFNLPEGLSAKAIVWHPLANALFVMGNINSDYNIYKIEKDGKNWNNNLIFSSQNQLRRLVACPRPFITDYDTKSRKELIAYRLFFGMDNGDKTFRIVSVTEQGDRFYQVVGPEKTFSDPEKLNADGIPSTNVSSYALPIAFHPAGHQMIWEDNKSNFYTVPYSRHWGKSKQIGANISSGTITPTPNGLGFIHWQKDKNGIGIYILAEKKEEQQITEYKFISTPSSVPDGKGIVGLTNSKEVFTLNYIPVNVPLADVLNAWMYIGSKDELELFKEKYGLFRPNHSDQLYKLYETENYYCNSYDRNSPTRPYLVTTDIFWELFGAAYQGLFIVKERDEAIPNFKEFLKKANEYYGQKNSKWTKVFAVLSEFNSNNPEYSDSKEVIKIIKETNDVSEITNEEYSFSNLKPRGHYTSTPEMGKYFKSFRYFTTILKNDPDAVKELESLPAEIMKYAENWINTYSGFIAPSRTPLVWKNIKNPIPTYCKNSLEELRLFPLSWGFDNEVLYSTIYHSDAPVEMQIIGPDGPRMLPSGLDIVAVLGNGFSDNLLASDFEKYPPLRKVIDNLKENFSENRGKQDFKNNIYNKWIDAVAVQWSDTVKSANGNKDNDLWQTKRIQTGLATWSTLRHATVLVNETGAAECGEGGFEEILMRAPRGYVEPDPYTFEAIADLFEKAIDYVSKSMSGKENVGSYYNDSEKGNLYDGIINRLKEASQEARTFAKMAEKEKRGEMLSNEENEKILYVARTAEHLFLIFNSLSNKDYALSIPDPMPKITDVAGDGIVSPYLMSAVGNSIEWDYIVPFYGRHQIVKGSVYSYYEFESSQILNDEEWREKVKNQEILPWIKPYTTNFTAQGMAVTGW